MNTTQIADLMPQILLIGKGIFVTLQLLIGALTIGITLATIASILRYTNYVVKPINILISLLRGTPLILQLTLIYFAVPGLTCIQLSVVTAGIITFGLNSFAYMTEILRAGIESMPKGQFEAAQTLQIPPFYMWKDIILPQVLKNILPAFINEIITLVKETALISTIGGMDIMRSAQLISAEKLTFFLPLCIAGAYYYILILLIEYAGKKLEQRGNHAKNY